MTADGDDDNDARAARFRFGAWSLELWYCVVLLLLLLTPAGTADGGRPAASMEPLSRVS
jgi:hypothetical protein